MKIKILTYSNPYHIDEEPFWDDIKNAAHFCGSQTMVNGMSQTYPFLREQNQITTIRNLINVLYSDWENENTTVKQIMAVDNAITKLSADTDISDNVKRSLLFNTKSIVKCLRIFKELGIAPSEFNDKNVNNDQKILLQIYKIVCENDNAFSFLRNDDAAYVDESLKTTLKGEKGELDVSKVDFDTVVIHGIHQFTPAILCAIEDISKTKNVILMFNYQEQYKSVYDTWLNIYSLFDLPINSHSDNQFEPSPLYVDSYKSNLLGDFIGKVSDGNYSDFNEELSDIEILEFENVTEFANYCAKIYENAKSEAEKTKGEKPVLAYMKEQFYSPSKKVNDILRAYFPEQFGERHFLDYPIGHFFVATMNMWDDELHEAVVDNFSDLKECLQSGIIFEKKKGQLLNTFNNAQSYFEDQRTLNEIIARLKNLKKYVNKSIQFRERIGYFNTSKEELEDLIVGLEELNTIENSFFKDFGNNGGSFKNFYKRIQQFIINKLNDMSDLDQEMTEVIKKLLKKLETSDLPNSGTYICLKQTMSFYLSQDDRVGRSAHWIVRGFEQIDGDILRSAQQDATKTLYHFCCLSDKDICASNEGNLPWPLDIKFFEYAHAPLDFKYQIFLKSKIEYKNFNKYALLYGLEFNRVGFKLSYVKNENDKDNDLYHLIELLGPKVKKYKSFASSAIKAPLKTGLPTNKMNFDDNDITKISLCPYRFALESIVQEKTIFRSRFLIHHYMRIIIGYNVAKALAGNNFDSLIVKKKIIDEYNSVSDQFKLSEELEKTQLIASVFKDIKKQFVDKNNKFIIMGHGSYERFIKQLDFLYTNLESLEKLDEAQRLKLIDDNAFETNKGAHCKYCASKDICLENKD